MARRPPALPLTVLEEIDEESSTSWADDGPSPAPAPSHDAQTAPVHVRPPGSGAVASSSGRGALRDRVRAAIGRAPPSDPSMPPHPARELSGCASRAPHQVPGVEAEARHHVSPLAVPLPPPPPTHPPALRLAAFLPRQLAQGTPSPPPCNPLDRHWLGAACAAQPMPPRLGDALAALGVTRPGAPRPDIPGIALPEIAWDLAGDLPVRMDSPPYSLAVLPSSRPVARCDAEAAADLLRRCRRDPATAARAAGAWREEVLAAACAPAVRALAASYPPAALQDTLRRTPVEEPSVVLGRSAASRQPCDAPVHVAHAADAAPAPRRAPEWPPARPWRDRVAPRRAAGGAPDLAFDPGGVSGGDPSISQPPAAHGFGAWDERCAGALAASLAVVAAEVVRQAAAGCADLAALLADAWNANTALLGGAARRARDQAVRLAAANAALAAEAAAARDAGRAQRLALLELARERQEGEGLRAQVAAARDAQAAAEAASEALRAELAALTRHVEARLRVLSWQFAGRMVGSGSGPAPAPKLPAGQPDASLLAKVEQLERTAVAAALQDHAAKLRGRGGPSN
ncbi:hypothetical protein ACKKBG_A28470 [Auxenochlorella protothecoides x Auxenochlorella symbiontica]